MPGRDKKKLKGRVREKVKATKETLLTPPNMVTLLRMVSIPVLVAMLYLDGPLWSWISGALFALASATDLLDGWLARRLKSVSVLGQYLDPVADKLLVSSMLIMLAALGRAPAWMAILIICREIAVTGMRAVAASRNFTVPSDMFGKSKTAIQMAAILLLILHHPMGGFDPHVFGMYILWVAVLATAWSGTAYFRRFQRHLGQ